jgi:hypothetical protein
MEAVFLSEAREYAFGGRFAPGGTLATDLNALDAHLSTSVAVTCRGLSIPNSGHVEDSRSRQTSRCFFVAGSRSVLSLVAVVKRLITSTIVTSPDIA